MKTFSVHCTISDKIDPSSRIEDVVDIDLRTIVESEDLQSALDEINQLYRLKEIIFIQEIL